MIKEVIILGNHIQGLGISRIAARLGYKVTLYNNSSISVARFSNTCSKFCKFKDVNHLLDILINKEINKNEALLIPTNDMLVGFISDNYDVLNEKYMLSNSIKDITELAFNKIKTYKMAIRAGVKMPESFFPNSIEELNEIADKIDYPVIIKPAIMYNFYKKSGKKVFLCNSRQELIENYNQALKIIKNDEVIVQEFLTGGAKNLYSFASYASKGEVFGSFIANRIRQKPMDFGVATTFAKTVISERIEQLALSLVKEMNYSGLSEIEFMYDDKIQDYKLIEINPRTWKWHTMSNIVGINLIEMLIKDLNGENVEYQKNTTENLGWIEQLTDFFIMFSEVFKGRMSLKEYFNTLKIPKEYATWDRKDPLPGVMYILLSPYFYLKR
ncbi:MAG: ATP-grasp domain-containing protein [Bacteroidales bacterium]|nr:ATP-grasp domain-containing protein [Bacteroidales bacterium]MBN2758475.1 ATP-grasp domain-containing protein [Bacteroidales bacterium]